MKQKAELFFVTEYNIVLRTLAEKDPLTKPKDAIWCGLHRCAGVAQFLDDPDVNDIYYEYEKKFVNLLKKY